jgi:PST family polysaccharide transporter
VTTVSAPETNFLTPEPAGGAPLLRNAGTLFAGQAVGMIVPLVTVPYLARVLGPAGWGPVLAAQAFGNWLVLVLEFGFELSGARAVSQARLAPRDVAAVVHGVQSAKVLLTLGVLPVLLIAFLGVPEVRHSGALLGWALAFAVTRGFSPLWFFQGIERVHGAVAIDTVTRALAALGVFWLVQAPADGWRVIALQAVFGAVSLVVLTAWLGRHVPLRLPQFGAAIETLRKAWTIFACRAWSGLYIQANTLVLSALAGPAVVGFFGGAERIVRAAISMLQPLTQVYLPRVSFLQSADPARAERTVKRALLGVGMLGLVMGLCAVFGAPILVHVLLGSKYDDAIPVLRLLGALPVLVAVNTVLGLFWALPFGHDRLFLGSIIAAAVTNVALAALLVPRWGAAGMAVSATAAEIVVLGVLGVAYLGRKQ